MSWQSPLTVDDFHNWRFEEASVPLANKIVLAPNGAEPYGFVQGMWTFHATSWEMSIDFEVDYSSEDAEFAKAEWQIYFLKHTPDAI